MLNNSLDEWNCVPSLLFIWGQSMVEVMKIKEASFNRSHACTATLCAPNLAAGHHRPTPLLGTAGHSRGGLGQSLVGSLLLSPGPGAHKVLSVPSKSLFPSPVSVLVALWWG